jgi:alpha-ribazole phosphatase
MRPGNQRQLWLVRHAAVLLEPGICYGRLNVAANAEATLACANELAKVLPESMAINSSPLQRCEQLKLALIAHRPDLTGKTEPKLQEMDFGQWEGRPWADIAQNELSDWTDHFASYPAGTTGETVSSFMDRVASVFDEIKPGRPTLWITHAGVIRAAGLLAAGQRTVSQARDWPVHAPACGQWYKLDW